MSFLSTAVQRGAGARGSSARWRRSTPNGPHCTPLVFAYSGARIWLTTSRRSVKARAWRVDPSIAGLVRDGDLAVTFTGTVRTYDALDKRTWAAAVAGATSIARATAGSAGRTPASSPATPSTPGRCRSPGRRRGGSSSGSIWNARRSSTTRACRRDAAAGAARKRPRTRPSGARDGRRSARASPRRVARRSAGRASGALAVAGERGPVVLPVRWRAEANALYAALPAETLAMAGADPDAPVALTVDRPSVWRARDMVGAMFQGVAESFVEGSVGSGAKSMRAIRRDRRRPPTRSCASRRAASCGGRAGRAGARTRDDELVEYSVEVDAPPEAVWAVTSDPRNLPHWDRHIVAVKVPENGLASSVEVFRRDGVHRRARNDPLQVLEWEPPWRAEVRLGGVLDATVTTSIAALPFDRSVLRHEVDYVFRGPLGAFAAASVHAVGGAEYALRRGTLAQKRAIEARAAAR